MITAIATALLLLGSPGMANEPLRQEISHGWKLKQVRGNNWYDATVPGVVQLDLLNNGIIQDPFFRLNERGIQWIDKEDWVYQTTLDLSPELFAKDNIELDFTGLDTYADVYLNDSCILKADNMFREWRIDVKSLLKQEGNELRVYFHSPIKVDLPKFDAITYPIEAGNDQSENGGILNRKLSVFARKAGYHYGWDWGPRIVTSGIWRPVYVVGWNNARIAHIHYLQEEVTERKAVVKARAEVIADKDVAAALTIRAGGGNTWRKNVALKKGTNRIELDMVILRPKLWWSNGLGEAHLYPFTAALSVDEDTVADTQTDLIGLRSLKVIYEKDTAGHTFHFELNGVRVFAKGANYIPQDNLLPRVTDALYEKTILDAVHANMNMLRVWGGGIYENKIFYDLCDKYGILIWQDFMFACSTYPMTPDMLGNIRQEAIDNVVRLRNHPCLAIWCGNNENHAAWFGWGWMATYERLGVLDELRKDYKDVFHGVLPEVVAEYDPQAFYWPSSPYGGDPDARAETGGRAISNANGDAHYWGVWHAHDSIANYNIIRSRFFSEYGFQSFPEYQSVLKYAPEERDHDIYSEVMMAHQRGGSLANGLIEWYLLNEYRKPKDFPSFLYMGQLLQGDAIKTAIEAHRRDMPFCMGSLFWQHNDCWPVASWSSRDYYGRWKAQHYFAKKAYADILVSPLRQDGLLNVYVVSDRLTATRGTLHVRVIDLKEGNTVYEKKSNVTLPANSSHIRFRAPLATILSGRNGNEVVVNVRFTEQGKEAKTYSNNYFPSRYKEIDFPKAHLHASSVAVGDGFDVTVESDAFARGVFLSIEGIENFFSDNYFDLLPGEAVTIHVSTALSKAAFDRQLQLEHMAGAY